MADRDRMGRIRAILERQLAPLRLDIADESALHAGHPGAREGGHFRVHIVSEQFRGRTALERHRLVYQALDELMGSEIHALAVVARDPEEITS